MRSRTKTKLLHMTIEYLDHNKQRLKSGRKIKSETKQSPNTKHRDQAPTKEPRKKSEEE